MKKMKLNLRLTALLMALMMLLSLTPAIAEQAEATDAPLEATTTPEVEAEDPVLATLNGEPILKSECDDFINYYASSYSLTYADAVDYLLHQRMFEAKIKELGFDQYTQEELDAFTVKAQAEWDDAIASYVDYFLTEDTEEARAEVTKQANEYYTGYGYSIDMLVDNLKLSDGYDRLEKYLLGDKVVTDEEIQAKYDETVASQKEMVGDSATMYEMYTYYYGDIWYVPSGYRSVLHILLSADEALMTAYENAQNTYEELVSQLDAQTATAAPEATAEATAAPEATAEATTAPVTQEQVDAAKAAVDLAKQAILDSKQTEISDIMTRLDAGEDFKTLIAQYGTDPGQDVEKGYYVHKDSIMWDTAFRDAAFSDKMAKIGDHSDAVVGSYGVHILYYLGDVAEGGQPMTEEIRSTISSELYDTMVYAAQTAAYDEWITSCEVVYSTELLAQLDNTAADDAVTIEPVATEAAQPTEAPAN